MFCGAKLDARHRNISLDLILPGTHTYVRRSGPAHLISKAGTSAHSSRFRSSYTLQMSAISSFNCSDTGTLTICSMTTPTRVDGGSAIEFAAAAHVFRIKKKTDAGIGMLGVVLEGKLVHGQEKVAVSHSFSIVRLLNRDFCSGEDDVF